MGVNRRTVARYAGNVVSKCTTWEGKVTAGSQSSCAPHFGVIAGMVGEGLTAQRIWQALRDGYGFEGSYEAVKRYVHRLKSEGA